MSSSTRTSFFNTGLAALAAFVLLMTAACGGDDDDNSDATGGTGGTDTAGQPGAGAGGAGAGGATAGTGGTGGAAGAAAGNVPEGSPCEFGSSIITIHGVCQQASAPCEGGTPDKFELKAVVPAFVSTMIPDFPAAANCQSNLVCCLNTDTCAGILPTLQSSTVGGMMNAYITDISCVPTGSCTGENPTEMAFGCPSGQSCCFDVAAITLPDAGI